MLAAIRYEHHEPEKTLLYQVIREQLETFLTRAQGQGAPVARFVKREIRAYLKCGVLAHGFLRVHCDSCGHDRLVAFSCKSRGFCPSCGGRKMADKAAWLVDRVLGACRLLPPRSCPSVGAHASLIRCDTDAPGMQG
ncbi:MAG TPA: hypothetical protein EYQ60_18355 [Myxococcales bacterium]|nr:hypothetical protein [Myxococcales bacterium]HIK83812.1 hypothetical protein [Myxococcales bacterium]